MAELKELRKTFSEEMEKHMEKNEKIVFFDADLAKGIGTLNLHRKFPDRAFNVGVAEANMASVAAGMSSYGYLPFITTLPPAASRTRSRFPACMPGRTSRSWAAIPAFRRRSTAAPTCPWRISA